MLHLSLVAVSRGYSLIAALRLFTEVASLAAEHGLQGVKPSGAVAPRL